MADTRLLATCWQELDPRVVKELEAVFRGIKYELSTVSAGGSAGGTGPAGDDGLDGRSVAVFDQAQEPLSAVAGDIWIVP